MTTTRSVLLATDAWSPQINGVVRTYKMMIREGARRGVQFHTLTPDEFPTVAMPSYAEIRLARIGWRAAAARIEDVAPDHVHIATEGPIGLAMRRACLKLGCAFTTAYHTRFPEYLAARWVAPRSVGYALQKWFHGPSSRIMVPSGSMRDVLVARGFEQPKVWSRGFDHDDVPSHVDLEALRCADDRREQPIALYVGRVAIEKNLPAFLSLDLPIKKIVVGGGPALATLCRQFPDVEFTGVMQGKALWQHYARADVFVFPSLTDTLGNVMIEAMAHGVPVAAFPVMGPIDLVTPGVTGVLDADLSKAVSAALLLDRARVRREVQALTWQASADQFFETLVPVST